MGECKHESFRVHAEVARLEDIGQFSVDVRVWCSDCGEPFEWVGLPGGFSHYQPCVSIDCQELRAPIVPRGGKVQPGLSGFRVTHTILGEHGGEVEFRKQ
jgi:hypothetical protein